MKIKGLPSPKLRTVENDKLRMVENSKPMSFVINSKEALKETVIDYIIHNTHNSSRKIKLCYYQPLKVKVQLNRQI